MGISKRACWVDSSGVPHLTRAECQLAELMTLLTGKEDSPFKVGSDTAKETAKILLTKAGAFVNILTMTDKSRLGARKANGARRKSRKSVVEQFPLPIPDLT